MHLHRIIGRIRPLVVCLVLLLGVCLLAAPLTDDFLRADSSTLGANWTQNSTGQIGVKSNTAQFNSGSVGYCQSTYTSWSAGDDQYSQASAITLSGSKDMGVVVRGGGSSDATATGYLLVINDTDASVSLGSSMSNGVYTINGTSSVSLVSGMGWTQTINANDVLRLEVVGTALTAKVNGTTKATGTSSAFSTGKPGIYIGGSGSTSALDDWSADVVSGGGGGGGGTAPRLPLLGAGPGE